MARLGPMLGEFGGTGGGRAHLRREILRNVKDLHANLEGISIKQIPGSWWICLSTWSMPHRQSRVARELLVVQFAKLHHYGRVAHVVGFPSVVYF